MIWYIRREIYDYNIAGNMGPAPGRFELVKGRAEVNISNASGIWDPQSEMLQIEIARTDRMSRLPPLEIHYAVEYK